MIKLKVGNKCYANQKKCVEHLFGSHNFRSLQCDLPVNNATLKYFLYK